MDTSTKQYSPHQSAPSVSPDTIADTARNAVGSMKETLGDAVERGQAVVSQAKLAAADMADSTTQQVKTFASELEAMTRRNPLGVLAGGVMTGVLIGLMMRGRD
jgi:hypothetical protein